MVVPGSAPVRTGFLLDPPRSAALRSLNSSRTIGKRGKEDRLCSLPSMSRDGIYDGLPSGKYWAGGGKRESASPRGENRVAQGPPRVSSHFLKSMGGGRTRGPGSTVKGRPSLTNSAGPARSLRLKRTGIFADLCRRHPQKRDVVGNGSWKTFLVRRVRARVFLGLRTILSDKPTGGLRCGYYWLRSSAGGGRTWRVQGNKVGSRRHRCGGGRALMKKKKAPPNCASPPQF